VSTRLHSRRRPRRFGPPGAGPPILRADRPPDGWIPVASSRRPKVMTWADAGVIHLAASTARGLNRREFIKKTGEVALVAGLALSDVLWGTNPSSAADGVSPCGPNAGGCGSSPICPSSVCAPDPSGPGQNCDLTLNVRKRVNATSGGWSDTSAPACGSDNASNCWRECCSGSQKRCCDCCVPPRFTNGLSCTSCSQDKRRCICRSTINTC
jgi:hypothetical protein